MASRAAQMLTEVDDDGDRVRNGGGGNGTSPPPGMSGSTVEVQPRQGDEPEFQIVEADENLRPIQSDDDQGQGQGGRQQADDGRGDQGNEPPEDETEAERVERERDPKAWIRRPKAEQRDRRRAARDRTYQELNTLRGQVQQLNERLSTYEPRFSEFDQNRLDQQVASVEREIQETTQRATAARRQMSEAMVSQDPEAFTAALEARDQAIMQGQQLLVRKNVLTSGSPLGRDNVDTARQVQGNNRTQAAPQTQQPRPLPPAAAELANDFAGEHDWIDMRSRLPDGRIRDRDSRLLATIDADIMADGFDPSQPEYWDELRERGREVLPHRFGDVRQAARGGANGNGRSNGNGNGAGNGRTAVQPERRGPMTGGASDRGPAPSNNQVYLNADRKMALVQAGALEADGRTVADKAKFNRLLRSYQEFDRSNATTRQ